MKMRANDRNREAATGCLPHRQQSSNRSGFHGAFANAARLIAPNGFLRMISFLERFHLVFSFGLHPITARYVS